MIKLHKDKVIIFSHKVTSENLLTVTINNTNISIDDFINDIIANDDTLSKLPQDIIHCAIIDKERYEKDSSYANANVVYLIDNNTNELILDVQKRKAIPARNRSYSEGMYKREYCLDQVCRMYNEDYIDVNLKNLIKTGVLTAEFIPIKDLNVLPSISQKTWRYFIKDPFLRDSHDDKLKLGRSVVEIGTWWPFVVAPMHEGESDLYVFEGNHRIISLKLLAMIGEISEDFKVFCLRVPYNFHNYKVLCNDIVLQNPVKYRYILEDVYGCDLLVDKELHTKTINKIHADGETMVNEYTVEAESNKFVDIMGVVHAYPIFLRDLIYLHDSKVKPSDVINNEEVFKEWIKN